MDSTTRLFQPYGWNWISLIGPDAQDFIHRVTTVNSRSLALGEGAPGFFLNPQGKVRAFFHLWNYREGEYAFEFAGGESGRWKKEMLAAVDQFTFAEKMTLADVTELECQWIFLAPGQSAPDFLASISPGHTTAIDEEIRVCHHGDQDYGRPWISAWGRGPRLRQWVERAFPGAAAAHLEDIELWRIQATRPRVDFEITDGTIPLEVGLKDAIADAKGCYPGQEVIERIVALGSPAKRLAKLEGSLSPGAKMLERGEKLLNEAEPPVEVGEVTSVARDGNRFIALAMIRKIHAKEGMPVRTEAGVSASILKIAPYQ